MFYSISNCQRGLAGVSFGNFLIKQVVEEISREMPKLSTFVTLSPAPNFAAWLNRERTTRGVARCSARTTAPRSTALDRPDWWRDRGGAPKRCASRCCGRPPGTICAGATARGTPLDSVARFHLGNGARLERLNFLADTSERALRQSYGLMVNYLYDLEEIEKNHEAYAQHQAVVAASAVTPAGARARARRRPGRRLIGCSLAPARGGEGGPTAKRGRGERADTLQL